VTGPLRTASRQPRTLARGAASGRDSAMTQDLGGVGQENQLFACGHENPASNRYCNACGAARDRRCPLCDSLNGGHARFCGACGARLLDEGTAPATTGVSPTLRRSRDHGPSPAPRTIAWTDKERASLLGSESQPPDVERPPWSPGSGWRRDPFLTAAIAALPAEDESEAKHRRRVPWFMATGVAATIAVAIAFGVLVFRPAPYGASLERAADRNRASPPGGSRSPAPVSTDPSAVPSGEESRPAASPAVTGESAQQTGEAPATPRAVEVPETSPLPRVHSPSAPIAEPLDDAARVPPAETSEERMADFLIGELGPAPAADKAVSTAAWYEAGRPERAYWQRVAEAIRRRAGS
jgi:hypothetical protein